MLTKQTGISRIQKLYLQMLFRCNFNCTHCFQGAKLQQDDRFSLSEAKAAISLFAREYGLKSVTLLGGEPFIHPNLPEVLAFCKEHGLVTAICTNGYRIKKILERVAPLLDQLRVSIDGTRETHDAVRRKGSFDAALETLTHAERLGIESSVTMTVMRQNVDQVHALASIVRQYGVKSMKLHQLRLIGNASAHPELLCNGQALDALRNEVARVREDFKMEILLDDDLDPGGCIIPEGVHAEEYELERIEVQPDGAMYVSCKAVGSDSNAFWLNKGSADIEYRPTPVDEIVTRAPQVQYARLGNGGRDA